MKDSEAFVLINQAIGMITFYSRKDAETIKKMLELSKWSTKLTKQKGGIKWKIRE